MTDASPINLRPYQTEAVASLRASLAMGAKRVILSSPTGSGKTEIGFEIIRGAQTKGKRVAFIANRIHLVDQTCRRLAKAGFEYGVVQGANTKAPWRAVLVCSIQTLARRGMPDVDLIVVDEAHACAGTKAYRDVIGKTFCIGLTATPYSKGLGKHYESLNGKLFEQVVTAARIKDLIRDGYLVSADVWAPSEPDLSSVSMIAGDYNERQLGEAVDKTELIGDIVAHWFKIAAGTPTVVFATNIAHSKHIVEQFRNAGVTAEHLDCYATEDERRGILERVTGGQTLIVSNVGVLAEGWDFPACRTLILARPTRSLIRYLQMAGRVLRPHPGKDRAIILDHSGVVRRLGFPWDDFSQDLDDGKPRKGGSSDRKEPLPRPCPQCSMVRPARELKCPSCGFEVKRPDGVEVLDGELVPLVQAKGIPSLREMNRGSIYHQLLEYARSKGFQEGWARHKYAKIYGNYPTMQKGLEAPCGVLLGWIRNENIRWAKVHKGAA